MGVKSKLVFATNLLAVAYWNIQDIKAAVRNHRMVRKTFSMLWSSSSVREGASKRLCCSLALLILLFFFPSCSLLTLLIAIKSRCCKKFSSASPFSLSFISKTIFNGFFIIIKNF